MGSYNKRAMRIALLAMLAMIILLSLFSTAQSEQINSPIPTPTPEVWIPDPDDNCGGMVPAQCLSKVYFAFLPVIQTELLNE
jgi:hypothetical protein